MRARFSNTRVRGVGSPLRVQRLVGEGGVRVDAIEPVGREPGRLPVGGEGGWAKDFGRRIGGLPREYRVEIGASLAAAKT